MAKQKVFTVADRMRAIAELEKLPDAPYLAEVSPGLQVTLFGSQICFTKHGDYLSLEDAQKMLEYWVLQCNGKVTWDAK